MATPDPRLIEDRFKRSLDRYILNGYPTGGFLNAVLENNLKEAVARADENALDNLVHIVGYLYNDAPSICWGSPQRVKAWLDVGWKEYGHNR